jgi:hypothetical protein
MLKHKQRFNADTLYDPTFDIMYGAEKEDQSADNESLPAVCNGRHGLGTGHARRLQ